MSLLKHRTHNCNSLNKNSNNDSVKLSGWVSRKRDHGGIFFIDLRDFYGITQIVFIDKKLIDMATQISLESVITVKGYVRLRPDEAINKSINTGLIEVVVHELVIQSRCAEQLPICPAVDVEYSDELRLNYRFLDLRRASVSASIILRTKIISFIRGYFSKLGFLDIQTPILSGSSPEGARDFLVPSRIHKGKFYALPQAPQQFKQLLMVSGFDKYFQIAPCFRDEDSRSDRTPGEFYQVDAEMSFVGQEDVFLVVENFICKLFSEFSDKKISQLPFKKMTYNDAIEMFGTDKPDLRNYIFSKDVSQIFINSSFHIFAKNISNKKRVRALFVKEVASMSRKFFTDLECFVRSIGGSGLAYISLLEEGGVKTIKGPLAKFITNDGSLEDLIALTGLEKNGSVFFISEEEGLSNLLVSKTIARIAEVLNIVDKNVFEFCWITDFPIYEREHGGKIVFSHNPFSMPIISEEMDIEKINPLDIRAIQYDLVCNGIELCSGAIRNHKIDLMYKVFSIAGYSKDYVDKAFSGLMTSFRYGPPPHGGFALGLDRIIMLIANKSSIKDVICFPMSQNAELALANAPSEVLGVQLRELGIKAVD